MDDFVAVKFGPCVMDVYYTYCGYGANKIDSMYQVDLDSEYKMLIDMIVESKRELMPWDFSDTILRKGGAWDLTFKNGEGNNKVIPVDLIRAKG
jgi:hypothetical protein